MGVTEQEAGRYDCRLGPDTLCSYNITVDTQRCAAPTKSHDYQKVYSDWCHEFEKYKMAMKTWERRQLVSPQTRFLSRSNVSVQSIEFFFLLFPQQQCNSRQNDSSSSSTSSNQNAHPNEIYPRSPLV